MEERINKGQEFKEQKLTKKQQDLLMLVYRFRFVTTPQIAELAGQNYLQTANERLNHLVPLGYLAKRHNASYRLAHRPAEYYATTKCVKLFRGIIDGHSERELKQLFVRAKVSERFVKRSVVIFSIYLQLRRTYGDRLRYSSKPELNIDSYGYFPQPLPDGFFIVKAETKEDKDQYFFIEYFDDAVSIGIHGRQINKYIRYKEDGEWENTGADFPTILIVCESEAMRPRVEKRVRHLTRLHGSNIVVRIDKNYPAHQ
ncbi:hypothetical protein A2707_00205 [Candidatus Saccharibacteria bacterium RIFCSPHIGHO2_01_FULL_45_15]|nr:MAG: hypothetical protein A2707_00205 [Candidatus Saccharibacteria bacterium RIFCSPHIGHO2_01_FULL_45_15]OGL28540.1 MAG: hypothetical protein A3C39_03765 [Candidatus Saccharibacteria bacterium RIFCSPHIGHO2_02_FULL_46_12]OGL32247.1 MAG: hypothetical protein A3E76_06335 [Candidatus Saccharibacteria bacterium RIFCSPHIGHO2_12_FULL_44_22]